MIFKRLKQKINMHNKKRIFMKTHDSMKIILKKKQE